jgi:hypothetical protein
MAQPAIAAAMGVSLSTVNRAHMAYEHGGINVRFAPSGPRSNHAASNGKADITQPPGGITLHRSEVVGNERRVGFIVSGLLFTMSGATPTCRRKRALTLVLPVLFHRK